MNFQYSIDLLCGSLNRACDVKMIFEYMGIRNTQSPIKVDFVFVNETYFDKELNRTFQPSKMKIFSCDQPVILPLSGGLDSRSQAMVLQGLDNPVHAYSYSFSGGYPEHKIAKMGRVDLHNILLK